MNKCQEHEIKEHEMVIQEKEVINPKTIQELYLKTHKDMIEEAQHFYDKRLGPFLLQNVKEYSDTHFMFMHTYYNRVPSEDEPTYNEMKCYFDGLKAMGVNVVRETQTCHNNPVISVYIF